MSEALAVLDGLQKSLAAIATVGEAKRLRDEAEAFRHYAKIRRAGLDAQNDCAIIRFLAERKAGELLAEIPRAAGPGRGKKDEAAPNSFRQALQEERISYDLAQRWQRFAKLPEEAFRRKLEALCTPPGYELITRDVVEEVENELGERPRARAARRRDRLAQEQRAQQELDAQISRDADAGLRHLDACRAFQESLTYVIQVAGRGMLYGEDRDAILRHHAEVRKALSSFDYVAGAAAVIDKMTEGKS